MKKISSTTFLSAILIICGMLVMASAVCCHAEPRSESIRRTIPSDELDSMMVCLEQFDSTFSIDDTILEEEDGEEAYGVWESYLTNDTLKAEGLRELYAPLAHNMLFVLKCQLECCGEHEDVNMFEKNWSNFLKKY